MELPIVDPARVKAEAAKLRQRYLERAAPHLVAEFGAGPDASMQDLRRAGLRRLAEMRQVQSRFAAEGEGGGAAPPPTPPLPPEVLQRRVDQLYSEYAAASTQLAQSLQISAADGSDADAAYVEVHVAAGWSTILYANPEGSVVEVPIDEVSSLLETGAITAETYVMVEGMLDYAPFREFVAMYYLEDELLGSPPRLEEDSSSALSPATRGAFRDALVEEALHQRPPLLSTASLQSVSRAEEVAERRRSLLRNASQTSITMLSPRSRIDSAAFSPRESPLSALSPRRAVEPRTTMRGVRPPLSPIIGSG